MFPTPNIYLYETGQYSEYLVKTGNTDGLVV